MKKYLASPDISHMASVCTVCSIILKCELWSLDTVSDCVLFSGLLPVNLTIAAYGAAIILGGSVLGLVLYFLATQVRQNYNFILLYTTIHYQ